MAKFPLTSSGGGWSNPTCLKCGQVSTQAGGAWALTPASGGLLMDKKMWAKLLLLPYMAEGRVTTRERGVANAL